MSATLGRMPEGRRGQGLAAGLLIAVVGVVWIAVASPLMDWYAARAERLTEQRLMLAHMTQIVAALPALRAESGKPDADAPAAAALLSGQTDAIAGAALQSTVQDIAASTGVTLVSAEGAAGRAARRIPPDRP